MAPDSHTWKQSKTPSMPERTAFERIDSYTSETEQDAFDAREDSF
jgi:hypothetical protein